MDNAEPMQFVQNFRHSSQMSETAFPPYSQGRRHFTGTSVFNGTPQSELCNNMRGILTILNKLKGVSYSCITYFFLYLDLFLSQRHSSLLEIKSNITIFSQVKNKKKKKKSKKREKKKQYFVLYLTITSIWNICQIIKPNPASSILQINFHLLRQHKKCVKYIHISK